MASLVSPVAMTSPHPTHKHPVLLFPLRLETRFVGSELLVRIYPDDVLVHAHDGRLSLAESQILQEYVAAVRAADGGGDTSAAWRGLVARVGRRRAAYLEARRSLGEQVGPDPAAELFGDSVSDAGLGGTNQRGAPRACLLPDRYVAYLCDATGSVALHVEWSVCLEGRELPLFAPPQGAGNRPAGNEAAGDDEGRLLFGEQAVWISDFAEAEAVGMAVRIPNVGDRYSRLIVIGLNGDSAEQGERDLTALLESHRFSSGVAVVPYETPTNNTADVRSGYWDDEEDADLSDAVECTASNIDNSTLGGRLAEALGLNDRVFQNIAHSGDPHDRLGEAARTLLWPALGDYYLQHMLSSSLNKDVRRNLYEHFREFVDARGPLPTIRVGKQPYGIVPVTHIRDSKRLPLGLAPPPGLDLGEGERRFETALRAVLSKLFEGWLAVANSDRGLVPRIGATADPDQELHQVLEMQPASVDVHLRRVVDDRFMGWVFANCGDDVIRANTDPGCGTLEGCTQFWVNQFKEPRQATKALLEGIDEMTAGGSAKLGESKVLDVYAWGEDSSTLESRKIPLVEDADAEGGPLAYIRTFRDKFPSQDLSKPLLYDLLRRANVYASDQTFRDALDIAAEASVTDLESAVRDALDLHSHRLDAWITSIATRRLLGMRDRNTGSPSGICTGAYGWVEDLQRAERRTGERAGGYIHAPSCAQAAAAAVLRNAYITHADDEKGNAYRINLSSERVRRAWRLVQGIREGQELGALLGYQFERGLHDTGNDRFIDDFRELYPLVAHRVTAPVADEAAEAVAARNVVDGYKLAKAWMEYYDEEGTTESRKLDALLNLLDDATGSDALKAQLERLSDTLDAVFDLLTYESVYQQVQGNYERGAAALEAMNGDGLPPEPESIQTPAAGAAFTHRVCVLLQAANGGWSEPRAVQTRATAEPTLARWFAEILGDMSEIGCLVWITAESEDTAEMEVGRAPRVVQLSDLGIDPIDFLYLCSALPEALLSSLGFQQPGEEDRRAGETELEARIKYFVRGQYGLGSDRQVSIDFGPQPQSFPRSFAEAIEVSRSVLPLLAQARYLKPGLLWRPESFGGSGESRGFQKRDYQELSRRVTRACRHLRQLDCADFLALSRFGIQGAIPPSPATDPDRDSRISKMEKAVKRRLEEYRQYRREANRLARPNAGRSPDYDKAIERLMDAMKALFGKELVVLPTFSAPGDHLTFDEAQLLIQDEERVHLWLQQAAQTHPALRTLEDTLLATDAWRAPAIQDHNDWDRVASALAGPALNRLRVAQLADGDVPYWLALSDAEIHARATTEQCRAIRAEIAEYGWPRGVLSLVCWSEAALDLRGEVCGFWVDEWSELIPSATQPTGLSFQYDGPNTQAPQALLLAVPSVDPGNEGVEWSLEELRDIVNDTLDLAKVRSVDVDALDETIGGLFPAMLVPSDGDNPGWSRNKEESGLDDAIGKALKRILTGTVSVTVSDQQGWPIEGVSVAIPEFEGPLGGPKKSGNGGVCDFSEVPFGNLTVTANHLRYQGAEQSIALRFGEQKSVQFVLQLLPGAIEGTAKAAFYTPGQAIPKATPRIGIQITLGNLTTRTDEKGTYRFESVDAGYYTITASLLLCKPVSRHIVVRGGGDTEYVDFELLCAYSG